MQKFRTKNNKKYLYFIQQEMPCKENLIKLLVAISLSNKLSQPEYGGVKKDILA